MPSCGGLPTRPGPRRRRTSGAGPCPCLKFRRLFPQPLSACRVGTHAVPRLNVCSETLPNFHLVPVFMPIPEIFLPVANTHTHKWNIHPVLFHQVRAIPAIFVGVPIMIIVMFSVVITPFTMMIVSHHRHWRNQGRGHQ